MPRLLLTLATIAFLIVANASFVCGNDFVKKLQPFFETHCYECHDDLTTKAGLDLYELSTDLSDPAAQAKWVQIYDRVAKGEMPPKDKPRPTTGEKRIFASELAPPLAKAHSDSKQTVLRRLNRREYQNTINDLLGVRIDAENYLPEDAKADGFDNVGERLGMSQVQLKYYLDLATRALNDAIAIRPDLDAEPETVKTAYTDEEGLKKFFGDVWLKAPDGATVFFQDRGYPSGMLRAASSKERGYYKIRVTGYAYQSEEPVTFSLGGTSFARGSAKPIYGYFALPPGKPTTIETTAWMEERYMVEIKPQYIFDEEYAIKNKGIKNYKGPGLAINSVEVTGPILEEVPSRGYKLIFDGVNRSEIEPGNPRDKEKSWYVPRFEILSEDSTADALKVLHRFASAAFRRPVGEDKVAPYLILFQKELQNEVPFEEALVTALSAMLCSADFLYLQEKSKTLDNYELANRLSYFLTRTAPDRALRQSAANGELSGSQESLRAHTERLLSHENFERFVVDFTDGWLDLRNIEFTNPDERLFPEFDRYLQESMLAETRGFFRELISNNLSAGNIAKSDFAMINSRLAKHYGIPGVPNPSVEKVSLPADSPRGSFLGQASVHKVSANGTNTSPVLRGVWINERILGQHPAPPPPGTPGVEPDIRGAETLRDLLEKHRDAENCQSCHEMIDPPGFALESFNPIGGWRDEFRSLGGGKKPDISIHGRKVRYNEGLPVDSSGQLQDGRSFEGFLDYRELIASDPDKLAKALTGKLLTFATGREMGFSDRPEINAIVKKSSASGHGLRNLLHLVVQSDIFRQK